MTLLGTDDLAFMRAQVAQALPGTCIIQHITTTVDSSTGWRVPGTAIMGTVACRIDPLGGGGAQVFAAQEGMKTHYQLTVPYDAPLAVDYQVVIDSDTYEVVSVYDDHSWRVSRRAIVSLLRI